MSTSSSGPTRAHVARAAGVAFGHSILAMSGEETLAQVYHEVESPKLKNFEKAALIVFLYSLIFTSGVCFLSVLLIPDDVRMARYERAQQ